MTRPKINVLSPIKVTSDTAFERFTRCINSYSHLFDNNTLTFKVADESASFYSKSVREKFESFGCDVTYVKSQGYMDAVKNLHRAADAEYSFWIFDDVELVTKKDIITPCIQAFEDNKALIQIKYGGGKVARKTKETNLQNLSSQYTPQKAGNETVYVNYISCDNETFVISQWNAVLRTHVHKELNEMITQKFDHWDSYLLHASSSYKKFLMTYMTGWLNFEDYLHPWGRSSIEIEDARRLLE